MIVAVFGLPGTGKTTVAKALGKELKAKVLTTDEIRQKAFAELGYSKKAKGRVYEVLFELASKLLEQEKNVVLDGTFYKEALRKKAKKLARQTGARIYFVECQCQEKVVRERIEKRFKGKKDFSQANYRVYKIIQARFEKFKGKRAVVDTSLEKVWKEKVREAANNIRVKEMHEGIILPLMKKKLFDEKVRQARLEQTHISFVILTGEFAYKIKKPVRFSFIDYSSLAKRKKFCEKAFKINRRLCPELYLEVVPITKQDGKIQIKGKGKAVEFAVKMKQVKQKLLLGKLLEKKLVGKEVLEKIAGRLHQFHARQKACRRKFGSVSQLQENFQPFFETRPLLEKALGLGGRVDFLERKITAFLKANRPLFQERVKAGKIRHCHGDVNSRNIFVVEGEPLIFDAIEFNEAISCCDVAAEIAFLAVDLDAHGEKELSDFFVRKYIEFSRDKALIKLWNFYKCYRACVNVLVEALKLADEHIPKKEKSSARKKSKKFLELAALYAKKLT